MAKILLTNTREHAIHLNVGRDSVLVPGAKQNPEDRSKVINGQIEVDDSFMDKARKNTVIQHYFKEGFLKVAKEPEKPKQQEAK